MIKLYNTLTRKVEQYAPMDGKTVRMYTCGPTVYNFAHIGNLRSFVFAELLYRTLKTAYPVEWVMNITDIDDKTIKGTVAEYGLKAGPEELHNFTEKYLQAFREDLAAMNVQVSNIEMIRVTDKMAEIQAYIVGLMEKGYAYRADDGVYFSIEKYQQDFGDYGNLVGEKFLEGKKIGARVAVDEYEKDNLSDFVLWKHHNPETDGQIFWDHPALGKGRPGWHIECSVINYAAFGGKTTDIHTGGVDLIFPHHTNEIAQSQPVTKPFVNTWCHSEHLLVDGKKMSKSLNNIYTLKDLAAKGFSALDLRYLFLNSSFRNQQNFTWESLLAAKSAREKICIQAQEKITSAKIKDALENDLNAAEALAALWESPTLAAEDLLGIGLGEKSNIEIPSNVQTLLDNRKQAKEAKDYTKSDELRQQIEALGFELMDTPEGQKVKKRINI